MFIEGVHFLQEAHKPAVAGRKALVRSLSDIAARGGMPRFCLVSLCVPGWAGAKWVDRFFDGILDLGAMTGTVLAGGDLSHAERRWPAMSLYAGQSRAERRCGRMTGRVRGHEIYVSGSSRRLGAWARGTKRQSACGGIFRTPEPRLAPSADFCARNVPHASSTIDLSDGLFRSICGGFAPRLPRVSAEIVAVILPSSPEPGLEQAAARGERSTSSCLPFPAGRGFPRASRAFG